MHPASHDGMKPSEVATPTTVQHHHMQAEEGHLQAWPQAVHSSPCHGDTCATQWMDPPPSPPRAEEGHLQLQLQAASGEAQELRQLMRSLQSDLARTAEEREALRAQLETAKDATRPPLPPGKVRPATLEAVVRDCCCGHGHGRSCEPHCSAALITCPSSSLLPRMYAWVACSPGCMRGLMRGLLHLQGTSLSS